MFAMKSMSMAAAESGSLVAHLLDGRPVLIPYLTVGYHRADDPAVSPTVTRLAAVGEELPLHPYTGELMALVEDCTGRLLLIGLNRLSHPASCVRCAFLWMQFEFALELLPVGAPLFEQLSTPVFTVHGPATLIVDAHDAGPDGWDRTEAAA